MIKEVAFINAISGQAQEEMKKYNILASLIIAQAILESGWGTSTLSTKGNNLFGIKSSGNWRGDSVSLPTNEYVNGKWIIVDAWFRKYPSWKESISDHSQVLNQPRYSNLIGDKDYRRVCKNIQADGYATDPSYANLLISLIEQYKLNQYDEKKVVFDVKNLVVYGNKVDKRASEYLADFLKCPTIDGDIPYDYSTVENLYCVGGSPSLPWSGYAKAIITGDNRYDTMQKVLNFITK